MVSVKGEPTNGYGSNTWLRGKAGIADTGNVVTQQADLSDPSMPIRFHNQRINTELTCFCCSQSTFEVVYESNAFMI